MENKETRKREDQIRARLENVLRQRAERLGVSLEAAAAFDNDAPLYRQAAEARAKQESTSADAVLDHYGQRILHSNYPSPDCLTPDDVLDYAESGALGDSQTAHLDTCQMCTALLGGSRPTDVGLSRFAEEVRQVLTGPKAVEVAEQTSKRSGSSISQAAVRRDSGRFRMWMPAFSGAFAAVLIGTVIAQTMLRIFAPSPIVVAESSGNPRLVKQFDQLQAAVQAELAETRRMTTLAEAAAVESRKIQESSVARQAAEWKAVLASLDEYKKLALSTAVAPHIAWAEPNKKYQKGDIITFVGASSFIGGPQFRVEDAQAWNDVQGEVMRSIKEIGLKPTPSSQSKGK